MARQCGRRKFLTYSCSTLAISLLLKACASSQLKTTQKNLNNSQSPTVFNPSTAGGSNQRIKIGILHSLGDTIWISEGSIVDAQNMAVEEINAAGGVLGKQIEAIVEDGASDWSTFAEKAKILIDSKQVSVVFGGGTSASRKALKPIFEQKEHMLWYPAQYEGQECSQDIFYTGATPNQQIEPAVDWLLANKGKQLFLVGSDYVFSRTANAIIKAQLKEKGGKAVGEYYLPLNHQEVSPIISNIQTMLPTGGAIFNTLSGKSNRAFFQQLNDAGLKADQYPVMSVSITEEEVHNIGLQHLQGHYATGNYFQTLDNPVNEKFVKAFKRRYGEKRVISDQMVAAYTAIYLWKQAVETAGTTENLEQVRQAVYGQTFESPGGLVRMETNHHLSKFVRIGQVQADGLFKIVYSTRSLVKPVPWNKFLSYTKQYACDWSDPTKGWKYQTTSS
ncbi:MAG: urea ABC transporter substrate-binding protein [Symploca sp. SIO2B6]|nr:urea ABC transporter substrate-binding protein [Symploca sp. SIO2B6]